MQKLPSDFPDLSNIEKTDRDVEGMVQESFRTLPILTPETSESNNSQHEEDQNIKICYCQDHPINEAFFICLDENKLYCNTCSKLGKHASHRVTPFLNYSNAIFTKRNELEQRISVLNNLEVQIKGIIDSSVQSVLESVELVLQNNLSELLLLKPIQKLKQSVSNLYLAIDSIAENRSLGYETLMNKLEEISSLAEKYRNFDLEGLKQNADKLNGYLGPIIALHVSKEIKRFQMQNEKSDNGNFQQSIEKRLSTETDLFEIAKNNIRGNLESIALNVNNKFESWHILSLLLENMPHLKEINIKYLQKDRNDLFLQFLPKFEKLNQLKSIKMNLQGSFFEDSSVYSSIASSFTNKDGLENLSLDFERSNIDQVGSTILLTEIENIKGLKSLYLNYSSCSELREDSIDIISISVSKIRELTSLSLNFSGSPFFKDENMEALSTSLLSFNELRDLSLNFKLCQQIGDNGIKILSSSLSKLDKLTLLELNLGQCSLCTNNGLIILAESLSVLVNLNELKLFLNEWQSVVKSGIQALSLGLKKLVNLRSLALDFSECFSLGDLELEVLCLSFKKLAELRKIQFSLDGCRVLTDSGVESLLLMAQTLPSIRSISLNLAHGCFVNDVSISSLAKTLSHIPELEEIRLDFLDNVSDSGLDQFSKALQNLHLIRQISLNLIDCSSISDSGVTTLANSLVKLKSLEGFELNLKGCIFISDKAVNSICLNLIQVSEIKSLVLGFNRCILVGDSSLKYIGTLISSLKLLKELTLQFEECLSLSTQGIELLLSMVKCSKSLKKLILNVTSSNTLNSQTVQKFKDEISGILYE